MKKETLDTVRTVFGLLGMAFAGVVVVKLFGVASIKGSITEWTCAAIACALAGR
jgi:hypothetical protein